MGLRVGQRTSTGGLVAAVMLGALWVASPAGADIYQCKHSDGSLHFTNVRTKGCKTVVRSRRTRTSRKRPDKATRPKKRPSRKSRSTAPVGRAPYQPLVAEAASLYHLPESFIRAVMRVESGFNPTVVSHAGAMGLMQLMPRTAQSMGVTDPFDPRQNILGGSRYLRVLANRFKGDLMLTIAGYNAGEHAVEKYNGIPPYEETQRYVKRVLKHYYAYRAETP